MKRMKYFVVLNFAAFLGIMLFIAILVGRWSLNLACVRTFMKKAVLFYARSVLPRFQNPYLSMNTGRVLHDLVVQSPPLEAMRLSDLQLSYNSSVPVRIVQERTLAAVRAWIEGVCGAPSPRIVQALMSFRPASNKLRDPEIQRVMTHLMATVVELVFDGRCQVQHRLLVPPLQALLEHSFPPHLQGKRSTDIHTDMITQVLSSARLMLITSWQASKGSRRRTRAIRRVRPLPAAAAMALTQPATLNSEFADAFIAWCATQLWASTSYSQGQGVLYQISSPLGDNYVGSTNFDIIKHQCAGDSPIQRWYQHLSEIRQIQ